MPLGCGCLNALDGGESASSCSTEERRLLEDRLLLRRAFKKQVLMRLLFIKFPQTAGAPCKLQRGVGSSSAFLLIPEHSMGGAGSGAMVVALHSYKWSVFNEGLQHSNSAGLMQRC